MWNPTSKIGCRQPGTPLILTARDWLTGFPADHLASFLLVNAAVLADEQADWRPERFGYQRWGCEVGIRFPAVKLLDFRPRWDELDSSSNPFAVVVQARLKTQETRHDTEGRYRAKLALAKSLELPQTGTEAQACGCPVVAFDCTGLPDVVEHGVTGYLARPYEPEDLAEGIRWVLEDPERHARLSAAARERAVRLWSPEVVVPQYLEVYRAAIEHWKAG